MVYDETIVFACFQTIFSLFFDPGIIGDYLGFEHRFCFDRQIDAVRKFKKKRKVEFKPFNRGQCRRDTDVILRQSKVFLRPRILDRFYKRIYGQTDGL